MNISKTIVVMVALVVTGFASAALVPVTYVVELGYESAPVPAHEADRLTVQRCPGCAPETVRFSSSTAYRLNGFDSPVESLQSFSQFVRQIKNKDELLFYVRYEADTKLVTELVLSGAE